MWNAPFWSVFPTVSRSLMSTKRHVCPFFFEDTFPLQTDDDRLTKYGHTTFKKTDVFLHIHGCLGLVYDRRTIDILHQKWPLGFLELLLKIIFSFLQNLLQCRITSQIVQPQEYLSRYFGEVTVVKNAKSPEISRVFEKNFK